MLAYLPNVIVAIVIVVLAAPGRHDRLRGHQGCPGARRGAQLRARGKDVAGQILEDAYRNGRGAKDRAQGEYESRTGDSWTSQYTQRVQADSAYGPYQRVRANRALRLSGTVTSMRRERHLG